MTVWARVGMVILAASVGFGCFDEANDARREDPDAGDARRSDAGSLRRDAGVDAHTGFDAGRADTGLPDAGVPTCVASFESPSAHFYDVTNDRLLEGGRTRFDGRVSATSDADSLPAGAAAAFEAAGVEPSALRWIRVTSQTGADWVLATAGVPLGFGVAAGSRVHVRLEENPLRLVSSNERAMAEIFVGTERAFFAWLGRFNIEQLASGVQWLRKSETCRRDITEDCTETRFEMELTVDGDAIVLGDDALEAFGPYDAWHEHSEMHTGSCTGVVSGATAMAFARSTPLFEAPGGACETSTFSTFPEIEIALGTNPCQLTLAEAQAGVAFEHTLEVDSILVNVHPIQPVGHSCPGEIAGGLFVGRFIDGNAQSYCECDLGPCPPPSSNGQVVDEGSYPGSLSWTGHNWNGPSDTNQPLGAAFPAGTYVFRVVTRAVIGSGTGPEKEASASATFTLE